MRYLMFSLTATALFLLACGDIDNPMVPTAPAGKATVDLSAAECAAAVSLPDGFLEQAREVDPDIDEALLLTTWKAHGCTDWAFWGLIWLVSLDADLNFDVEDYTTPEGDFLLELDGKSAENLTEVEKSALAALLDEPRLAVELECEPVPAAIDVGDGGEFTFPDLPAGHRPPEHTIETVLRVNRPLTLREKRDPKIISSFTPKDFDFLRIEVSSPCESVVSLPSP